MARIFQSTLVPSNTDGITCTHARVVQILILSEKRSVLDLFTAFNSRTADGCRDVSKRNVQIGTFRIYRLDRGHKHSKLYESENKYVSKVLDSYKMLETYPSGDSGVIHLDLNNDEQF